MAYSKLYVMASVILAGLAIGTHAQSGGGYYYTAQNFYYYLYPGDVIFVTITPDSTADWNARIKDPANNTVRSTLPGTGVSKNIYYSAPVEGTYTVQTYWYSGSGGYSYSYSITRASSGQQTTSGGTITNLVDGQYYTYSIPYTFRHWVSTGYSISIMMGPVYSVNYDLRLRNPQGTTVATSQRPAGETDVITYAAGSNGGYYDVDVYWVSGGGSYTYTFHTAATGISSSTTSGGTSQTLNNQYFTWQSGYSNRWDGTYCQYNFSLTAGATFTATTSNATGYNDTYLYLLNSSGTIVASNDDWNGTLYSRISYTPSVGGTYTLRLRAYGQGQSGYCTLTTSSSSSTSSTTSTSTTTTTTTTTTTSSGSSQTLNNQYFAWQSGYTNRWDGTYAQYSVTLTAGVTFTATTSNASGYNDTYLYLLNSSGAIVASNDDWNGTLYSRISFTPTYSGTYTVRLRAYSQGYSGYCTLSMSGQQ